MDTQNKESRLVSVEDYHRHLPVDRGKVVLFSENQHCLKLDSYVLPPSLDEHPSPVLDMHTFGVILDTPSRLKVYKGKVNESQVFSGYYDKQPIAMIPRGQSLSYQWKLLDTPQNFDGFGVFLPHSAIETVVSQNLSVDPSCIDLQPGMNKQCSLIIEITRQLIQLYKEPGPLNQLYLESATQLFATHVLKNWCTHSHKIKEYKTRLHTAQVSRIREYIYRNIGSTILLADLAALLGLSEYHFIRQFKASTGYSPYQYVVLCRIEQAKEYLAFPELNITDIGLRLGFSDGSHFARVFRKLTGVSPRQYRLSRG